MKTPKLLDQAKTRLEEIKTYGIIGSVAEESFDFLTRIAAETCNTEYAFISFVLDDRVWFKSKIGIEIDELVTDDFFCFRTLQGGNKVYVEIVEVGDQQNGRENWRQYFPDIKFYAGVPLITSKGISIGTLCVLDSRERSLSYKQKDTLKSIANQTMNLMELRRTKLQTSNQITHSIWDSQRLKNILSASQLGTWEWNIQTGEVIYNDRWAEMVGYTIEELYPLSIETWNKFIHPDDLKMSNEKLKACFEKRIDFYDIECRLLHKNGYYIWINDRGMVLSWSEEGLPLVMYGTHTDISERKKVEVQFETISNNIPGVVFRYKRNLDGKDSLKLVSKAAIEIWGISAEEAMLNNSLVWGRYHEDDMKEHMKSIEKSSKELSFWEHEWRYHHPDGTLRWHKGTGNPTRLADGNTIWDSLILDITEEKLAKIKLLETQKRFQYLFSRVTNLSVQIYDSDGIITFWNEASEKIYGYSQKDAIGQKMWNLIAPLDKKTEVKNKFLELIGKGESSIAEELIRRDKTNKLITVFSNQTILQLPDKNPELICIDVDLSPLKKANAELTQTLFELNERVKEQTCLYKIAQLSSEELSNTSLLNRSVEIIPEGWVYPELAMCTIIYGNEKYQTKKHSITPWSQSCSRLSSENLVLEIHVSYIKEVKTRVDSPFLLEEQLLLESIADNLVSSIDRMIAKQKIEESESRLSKILNTEPECVKIVDRNGKLLEMNPAGLKMIEADDNPKSAIGQKVFNLIHSEDLEIFTDLHKMALKGGQGEARFRIIGLKGTLRWMESTSVPLKDKNGRINSVLSVTRDISEKIVAEDKLLLSEKRFKSLVQEGSDLITILDIEGNFTYISPNAVNYTGHEPEEMLNKNAFDLVHEDDREMLFEEFSKLQSEQRIHSSPYRFLQKDNTYKYFQSIGTNLLHDVAIQGIVLNTVDITDSINAAQELKISEEKYRTLFNSAPLPKLIYDLKTYQVLNVNKTALTYSGYSIEEILQMTLRDLFLEDKPTELQYRQQELETAYDTIHLGIYVLKRKDNTYVKMDISGHKLEFNGRDCMMIVCVDVTEKEQVLNQLKDSERKLRTAQEIAKLGYWHVYPDERGIFWSEEVYRICEMDRDQVELSFDTIIETVHPDDRYHYDLDEIFAIGETKEYNFEHRILLPDGKIKWVHIIGQMERDDNGNPIILQGTAQDITQRKLEEQHLKMMESVITNTKDGVLITGVEPLHSPGPTIVFVNEAFTKMTGYTADEIIGKSPKILQGPRTDQKELDKLRDAMINWQPCEITTINYKKSGEEFWINFSISPVADEKGWYTHWIAIERDVTVQKNQELEKQLLSDISILFNKEENLQTCLANVAKQIADIGEYSIVEVWLPNFDKTKLKMAANYVADTIGTDFYINWNKFEELDLGQGLPGIVWKEKSLNFWQHIEHEDQLAIREAALKSGIQSFVSIPLSSNEEMMGVLVLGAKDLKSERSYYFDLFTKLETFIGAEIKRKRLESELNQIFASAPDIICLADFEGRIRKINTAGKVLLGLAHEDKISIRLDELLYKDDVIPSLIEFNKLLEGVQVFNFENRFVTRSGDVIWLSWTCNSSVEDRLIYAVAKDITEIKKLQNLLDNASKLARVGSWEIDLVKDTVFWSDITKEIREVETDFYPTLTKGIDGFVKGYDQDTIEKRVKNCIENGVPWDDELQIITQKGNFKWIRTIGKADFIDGKCVRIYGSFQDIHDRKMVEIELLQFKKVIENSKDGIALADMNGNTLYLNPEFTKALGHTAESLELNGGPLSVFADQDIAFKVFSSLMSGNYWKGDIELVNSDHERLIYYLSGGPIFDDKGVQVAIYGIHTDISERKKAEKDLQEAFEERNTILESIGDGFFTINKDWIVTYWNNQAETIMGLKREKTIGETLWKIYPDAVVLDFYNQYHRAMESGQKAIFEEYYPALNMWLEVSVYPSVSGLSIYFKDVSLRKFAEEQVRQSNERFEKVTMATNDAIWDWNLETETLFWGEGFRALFGYESENLSTSMDAWSDYIHPADLSEVLKTLNEVIQDPDKIHWVKEYRYLKADGNYAYVIDRGVVIRNENGKAIRMVGAMADITYRKEHEDSLKMLNEELEKYSKELELSNAELEQFAYIASHDLQEPLRMVTSFLSQLEKKYKDKLDSKAQQYIYFATDGAKRMRQIILDLLDFSRAGKFIDDKELIDLKTLIDDYLVLRSQVITEKSATIIFENLPIIETFKAPLIQTLHNLFDNALKYTKPHRPPVIHFDVIEQEKQWLFSVQDNGIGIKKEFFEKIFVIFQRLHNREEFSGTGMGLAIVKKNVESLGGKIWIESDSDKGSTFYFTLPK